MHQDGIKKKFNAPPIAPTFADFGKLPPQAIDIEVLILGAILIDSNAIYIVNSQLTGEMFYKESHQHIYNACLNINKKGGQIDIATCAEALRNAGNLEAAGGAYYIAGLSNAISTAANIEYHAKIVIQKFIQRKVIQFSSNAIQKCFDETIDIFEVIDEISDNLREVNNTILEDSKIEWKESVENYTIDLIDKVKNGIKETGISLGLTELDRDLKGLREGLYIVAGRPSMGKTAFALEMARRIAKQKKGKVGIFSLEMSMDSLINRIVSSESEIDQSRLINADLTHAELDMLINGGSRASELDFLINDKSSISINQICSKAKVWANKNNIAAIVIDYIQLVRGTNKQRHLEIGEISKGCKALSKDLGIPVIALAQLGREKDAGKTMPKLGELRESGDLEQDADVVMLLYRPEYYGIDFDANGLSTAGLTKVIIAKNRNGKVNLKGVNLRSNLSINRYEDWESELKSTPNIPEKQIKVNNGRDDEDFNPF